MSSVGFGSCLNTVAAYLDTNTRSSILEMFLVPLRSRRKDAVLEIGGFQTIQIT